MENTKCNCAADRPSSGRWFALSALYYGLLSALSHIEGAAMQEIGFDLWDKGVHFCAYTVLGVLITAGIRRRFPSWSRALVVLVGATAVSILGALDELHQSFVPGRLCEFGDAVADTLGGLLGAILAVYPLAVLNHFSISRPMVKNKES